MTVDSTGMFTEEGNLQVRGILKRVRELGLRDVVAWRYAIHSLEALAAIPRFSEALDTEPRDWLWAALRDGGIINHWGRSVTNLL